MIGCARAEVGDPCPLVGCGAERTVESGPALGTDVTLQGRFDLVLAAWAELQGNALRRPFADATADIVATDDEVPPIIAPAANQDVNMRIVGVPMIDSDPVQPRREIALDVHHQLAGEGTQILHLGGILRRDDEAEMMPITLDTACERLLIRLLGLCVEHRGVCAIARDTIALEIADVLGQRRRAELSPAMPDHPRLDDHPARRRAQRQGQGSGPPSAVPRAPASPVAP